MSTESGTKYIERREHGLVVRSPAGYDRTAACDLPAPATASMNAATIPLPPRQHSGLNIRVSTVENVVDTTSSSLPPPPSPSGPPLPPPTMPMESGTKYIERREHGLVVRAPLNDDRTAAGDLPAP